MTAMHASRAGRALLSSRTVARGAGWRRLRILAAGAVICVASTAAVGNAQGRVEIEAPAPGRGAAAGEGPFVRSVGVMGDEGMRDLLRSGFPARLHYRVEVWSTGGFVNNLERSVEWDVIVRYDALNGRYRVARIIGDRVTALIQSDAFGDALAAVERPYRAPVAAPRGRRVYYNAVLDVETLSLTELDELERWLRGEVRPAVRGQTNPLTPLTRGVRQLFVRIVGSERRHYEARTRTLRTN